MHILSPAAAELNVNVKTTSNFDARFIKWQMKNILSD